MKAIYCHGGSPHDKATPLAFTQFRPQKAEYQSFLLSYRLFLRGNILFLYWCIFILFFQGTKTAGRRWHHSILIKVWIDFSVNLFTSFPLIFANTFFVSFSTTLAIYTVNYSLFHMLVNIMKNMNVIKKNYFYKYANLFWVK